MMNKEERRLSRDKYFSYASSEGAVVPICETKSLARTVSDPTFKRNSSKKNTFKACLIPEYEDKKEEDWLVEQILELTNILYLLYSDLIYKNSENWENAEFPTGVVFLWRHTQTRKLIRVSASKYVSNVFEWVELQLLDTDIFPHFEETPFGANYFEILKKVCSYSFKVYSILLHNERLFKKETIVDLRSSLKFFLYFSFQWNLLSLKNTSKIIDYEVLPIHRQYLKDKQYLRDSQTETI